MPVKADRLHLLNSIQRLTIRVNQLKELLHKEEHTLMLTAAEVLLNLVMNLQALVLLRKQALLGGIMEWQAPNKRLEILTLIII
ncbi:hypothetical protein D3C78_893420 [compost metagenome]